MDIRKFNLLVENYEEKEKLLNEAVKNNPGNAFLWMMLLQCKIKFNPKDVEAIRKLFNKAVREVCFFQIISFFFFSREASGN